MGDGLQSAGHHMDVHASSVDGILEDKEHLLFLNTSIYPFEST